MNREIHLQRENRELKEHLQDAVSLLNKYKTQMGLIDQEELARLEAKANGTRFNPNANNDLRDYNGEQGI